MSKHAPWAVWVAAGIAMEWFGWRNERGRTLSRAAQAVTCAQRCRWSPLVWVALGVWFAHHVRTLGE